MAVSLVVEDGISVTAGGVPQELARDSLAKTKTPCCAPRLAV